MGMVSARLQLERERDAAAELGCRLENLTDTLRAVGEKEAGSLAEKACDEAYDAHDVLVEALDSFPQP